MARTIVPYSDRYRQSLLTLWSEALPLDAINEDRFEQRVLLDENFDPASFLLAFEGDTLVGFVLGVTACRLSLGDADPEGKRSWITMLGVHPLQDLRTVGGELLSAIESRFVALGKNECRVAGYPPGYFTPGIDVRAYRPLLELFLSHGYKVYHEALSMDAPIVLFTVPEKTLGIERRLREEGIEIRVYRRTDVVRFLEFLEKHMPTDWVRVERRNLRKIAEGGFRPDQITLVTKGEEVIGYCQFEGSHFGPFGVSDAYQGRGIGTVLLARTLERMRQQGYHDAWVMWTDDLAAKVYSKFGFNETRRFALLQKRLQNHT